MAMQKVLLAVVTLGVIAIASFSMPSTEEGVENVEHNPNLIQEGQC